MLKWRLESRDSFYEVIKQWWVSRGFPVIPFHGLPSRIFVAYIEDDKSYTDVYAVPVYVTDSNIAWIGYPTSNPMVTKDARKGAFPFLLEVINVAMKYQGYGTLLTTSMHPKLMADFEANDFIKSDEGTNFFTKNL